MQKTKPMKLVGARSLHTKLMRLSNELKADAARLDGTPHWIIRDRLSKMSEQAIVLAVIVERKGRGAAP